MKASRKDIEAAVASQKVSVKFISRIRQIMAFNLENKNDEAEKQTQSSVTGNTELDGICIQGTSSELPSYFRLISYYLPILYRNNFSFFHDFPSLISALMFSCAPVSFLHFSVSIFSTPTPTGPRHGAMSRVDLGMLIRESGTHM